jgi:hypothetical protein
MMRADQLENYIDCYWYGLTPRFMETAGVKEFRILIQDIGLTMRQARLFADAMGITIMEDRDADA